MSHFDKAESIATNTLLIPDIPPCFFGCDDAMLLIHDSFAEFGPIYTFVQMKGFRRLMIIFQETVQAMKAKTTLDKHVVIWKERKPFPKIVTLTNIQEGDTWEGNQVFILRVYYGQHYSIHVDPKSATLQVPQFERNLLISPPGAPFEGWEQIEEDAPNQAILASDLMHAAEVSDYELDDDEFNLDNSNDMSDSTSLTLTPPATIQKKKSGNPTKFSIVCAKGLEQPEHLPSITVQDWDGNISVQVASDEEEAGDMFNKKRKETKTAADIVPTAMPPMHR